MTRSAVTVQILSQNLDRIMSSYGLKNAWLAAMIDVSREMVRQWRSGLSYPSHDYIIKLKDYFLCAEVDLTHPVYSANIIKLMEKHNLTKETLSEKTFGRISVARLDKWLTLNDEILNNYGGIEEYELKALMIVFGCTKEEIFESAQSYETISLNAWARRERIPVTRAKDLFALEVLEGALHTDFCILVPKSLIAPDNSKQLVTLAKKRPKYGSFNWNNFHTNISAIMDRQNISNIDMANELDVVATTISHWRTGVRKPSESKLEMIAKICNCKISDLLDKEIETIIA